MTDTLSEAEIAERVAEDDGPADETVLIKRTWGGARHVYHDTDDPCFEPRCDGQRSPPEETTRADAIERGLAPCRRCLIGFETADSFDMTAQRVARAFDPDRHDSLADARAELEVSD